MMASWSQCTWVSHFQLIFTESLQRRDPETGARNQETESVWWGAQRILGRRAPMVPDEGKAS